MIKKIVLNTFLVATGVLISLGILKSFEYTGLSGFRFSCNASALDEEYQGTFSQNDITFYDPTCTTSGGGPTADTSFKIDESTSASDFWYAEGCLTNCESGHYVHTAFDTASSEIPRTDTKTDNDFGGMQYIYAENYDFDLESWPPKMTRKSGANSTRKYYWIVLPTEAYSNGPGETYVATFEKISEPVYFITFDTHQCKHQSEKYCEKAKADPDGVKAGKEFLGAISKNGGNYTGIVDKAGKLTSLHRINGRGEVTTKEFKISGSTTGSTGSTSSSSGSSSKSTTAKWKDGWLEEGSITGAIKEDVNNKSDLDEKPNKDGSYTTDGKPNKILLHYTEGTKSGYEAYPAGNKFPAHFTIDAKNKKIVQAFSLDQPALAIKTHDKAAGIQIEIVSKGYDEYSKYSDDEWDYIATLLVAISNKTGIPLTSSVEWSGSPARLSAAAFNEYKGVLGHMHAPDNNHDDPGDIWKFLEPAIKRVGGNSCNSYEGDYPEYLQGGGQPWSNLPYGNGKTVAYRGCGLCSIAMLATVATGKDILPTDVYDFLGDQRYPDSSNPYGDLDAKVGEKYGFEAKNVNYSSKEQAKKDIINYMDQGYMIHLTGSGCHCGFQNGSKCSGGHFIGLAKLSSDKTKVQVLNSAYGGNSECPLDDVIDAMHNGHYGIIKGNGAGKNTCNDVCNENGNQKNGDVLSAVEEIIALANKNGSTYTWGGGHYTNANQYEALLKGPINVDCTGFASLVMYKAFGEEASFSSSSIFTHSSYKEIDKKDAQPGDIFAYNSPQGHGGIIIEVENGQITKIAETGGSEGRSGGNTNIGYSGPSDFSVQNINSANGHIFRYIGG